MMRAINLIVLAIFGLGFFTSCEELDLNLDGLLDDVNMNLTSDYVEVEMFIPPVPAGVELTLNHEMQSDIDEMMAEENISGATVNSVKVLDAKLILGDQSNVGNLNSIDELSNSISTVDMPKELIAHCKNEFIDATELMMEVPDTEIVDYIQADAYTLSLTGKLKETLTDTLWVKAKIRYEVSITVAVK